MNHADINFDEELDRGAESYEDKVGHWWNERALDDAHADAYQKVADHVQKITKDKDAPIIIDYACGNGILAGMIFRRIPNAIIIAIDGSSMMIEKAKKQLEEAGFPVAMKNIQEAFGCEKGIYLCKEKLPDFDFPEGKADVVVFNFPNIVPHEDEQDYYDKHGYKDPEDTVVAKELSELQDTEDENDDSDPEDDFDDMLTKKVITRNLRQLLKCHGFLVKVDYANGEREEYTDVVLIRTEFEEGVLNRQVAGIVSKQLFTLLDTKYFESEVILDVYHQTGDEDDKEGGYFISTFKTI